MKYTDMQPDTLYRYEDHLFVFRNGRYLRLPFDIFSQKFMLPWQQYTPDEMALLDIHMVTVGTRPPGVDVVLEGSVMKFRVRIAGKAG